MKQIDLTAYNDFVMEVCAKASKDEETFVEHCKNLSLTCENVNIASLLTGAIGLSSESGEFAEIVKKVLFQGKPLNGETIFHAKRELGDVIWYWIVACNSLGISPQEVIIENVNKLKARYPGGQFDVYFSENRKAGDL